MGVRRQIVYRQTTGFREGVNGEVKFRSRGAKGEERDKVLGFGYHGLGLVGAEARGIHSEKKRNFTT